MKLKKKRHKITFNITPRTKQAVRFSKHGAFQPKSVTDFEQAVKARCREYMAEQGMNQITEPVRVSIRLHKDKFVATLTLIDSPDEYYCEVKGDVDNYAKAMLDGMQGKEGIIGNDRQVWELNMRKHTLRRNKK